MDLDLFAGPGGWDEGRRLAGATIPLVGIEHNLDACLTASHAGHWRIQADVATYPTAPFRGKVDGLIASPPCQSFSAAGSRKGLDDPRGELVWQPLRWATELQPRWVALEQVPEVLPIWRMTAGKLRGHGYNTWTGILNSADYGVPQTRLRAVLIARLDGPAAPAEPSHAQDASDGLFGTRQPWVSMSDALGWGGATQRHHRGEGMLARHGDRPDRAMTEPSFTITAGSQGSGTRLRWIHDDGREPVRVSIEEAAALQGFRPDYPWAGNKTERYEQIGNAIPPRLARAVLAPLLFKVKECAA
jgi:DNA (cytosine-5)-methyltransferase 1